MHDEQSSISSGRDRCSDRILLAEDDDISQLVTLRVLQQAGFLVDAVNDGRAAITALESNAYGLVLTDCYMPDMDGFSLTRAIRNSEIASLDPGLPVIALTALTADTDLARCQDAGMDDVVCKPIDAEVLVAAVRRHLGRARSAQPGADQAGPGNAAGLPDGGAQRVHKQPDPDPDFRDALIDMFLDSVPREVRGLQEALSLGDLAGLRDMGHRLKGMAAIIEASNLTARAQALEQAGSSGDSGLAEKLTADLIAELEKLTSAMPDPPD